MRQYTPYLTDLSGQILTSENWQQIGIHTACVELEALLIKPSITVLKQITSLHAYLNWHGALIVYVPKGYGDTLTVKSSFDGQTHYFKKTEINNLIQILTTANTTIQASTNKADKIYHMQPANDAISGLIYRIRGDNFSICDSKYALDFTKLDEHCECPACSEQYTRAYFHHLFQHTPLLCHRWLIMHNYHSSPASGKSIKSPLKSISS